jgi:hypothetical protein
MHCENESLQDDTPVHSVYMVLGLSSNLAGFTVSYADCATDTGLGAGAYLKPYDSGEERWYWQVFPDSDFVRNGSLISRAFPAPGAGGVAMSQALKFGLVTAEAPPSLAQPGPSFEKDIVIKADSGVPGSRYAGFRDTGWVSDLFEVYTADWGTVTYTHLETVCGYLYDIYNKIQLMGFPLATEHASIFPIVVRVGRNYQGDGGSVNNPITGSRWLEVNASLLTNPNELKATLGHEVMHYVLNEYTRGDSFAFGAMEDAITTWFEAVASENPDHRSGNYTARRAAPLKSLFVPISRSWYGARNWGAQEKHGYAVSAFVDYHFDHRRDWVFDLATRVKNGATIKSALDGLFSTKLGVLYDLERQYLEFTRDYLMTETNCYSSDVNPDVIFSSDAYTDYSKMYKLVSIKKASTNLLEEQEVDFKIQDYGSGVIQFKIYKPDRIFAPHAKLRVTAPQTCNSLDIMMQFRTASGETQSEIVNGVYGSNGEGSDEWSCTISLQEDSQFILLSVLATVGNEGQLSDFAEAHDVKITYQFEGDYYMPMQESFVRFTELNSKETYYDNQVISDAIVRIVDPAGVAGFTDFRIERTTGEDSHPDMNYALNWAFPDMVATRRAPGAFQIRFFSDTSVPDLEPYTINVSTNGYDPYTRNYQTPVLAGDATPQLELMVYDVPAGEEVSLGLAGYRIHSELISVGDMRQSADGNSGGILVDIPAESAGSRCLVYLSALDEDTSIRHHVFYLLISPVAEGTP